MFGESEFAEDDQLNELAGGSQYEAGQQPGEDDYVDVFAEPGNNQPDNGGNGGARPAQGEDPSGFQSYLQQDLQFRREEMQRRQLEEQQRQQEEQRQRQAEQRQQRQQQIEQQLNSILPEEQPVQLSPEEQAAYSQSLPLIQRIAAQQTAERMRQLRGPMQQLLEQNASYEERFGQLEQRLQRDPAQELQERLRLMVPDIDTVIQDPSWNRFKTTPVGEFGVTYGELINNAWQRNDAIGVKKLIDQFRGVNKTRRVETPSPTPRNNSGPSAARKRGKMLRASDLDRAYERFTLGQLDQQRLRSIEAQFEEAAANGLVDYER